MPLRSGLRKTKKALRETTSRLPERCLSPPFEAWEDPPPFPEPHFQQNEAARQAARAGLGAKPQMNTQSQSRMPPPNLNPLGRSPKLRGAGGTEASVCPVGTCAKRKANRRSQPKRGPGTAVHGTTIEVAGVPCRGLGWNPNVPPSHGFVDRLKRLAGKMARGALFCRFFACFCRNAYIIRKIPPFHLTEKMV